MTDHFIKQVAGFCIKNRLIQPKQTILIGLSGGCDSVALFHIVRMLAPEYQLQLYAAHLNHHWRTTANRDQAFCQQLCQDYNIPYIFGSLTDFIPQIKHRGSQEDSGRQARRLFFDQCTQEYSIDTIALAHHANDQLETFFIRLARGTGITGLCCIQPHTNNYIRPLLSCTKQEIKEFLQRNNFTWVEDETNQTQDCLRNAIRHTLLPTLTTIDKRFEQKILETINHVHETEKFIKKITTKELTAITITQEPLTLSLAGFLVLEPYLQSRVLQQLLIEHHVPFTPSQSFLGELLRFMHNHKSSHHEIYKTMEQTIHLIKKQDTITCQLKINDDNSSTSPSSNV
jgi:tRNA(Ile)-lysidine synthase